jgi:hypothetical protein
MLSAIFSSLGGAIIDKFFGNALKAFEMYNNKQISMEELRTQLLIHLGDAFKAVEVSHSETLAKTYASFMDAMSKSKVIQYGWATALYSQLFVLFWSQWVVPMLFAYGLLGVGWKAGTSAEWAYLIVVGLLGMAPVVLRAGPGAGNITDRLKAMVAK